jgi:hypothetical protein
MMCGNLALIQSIYSGSRGSRSVGNILDSSVGIATGCMLDDRGSSPSRGNIFFSAAYRPVLYTVSTGGSIPGDRTAGA